jgi:hypothetical protein
MKNWFVSFKRKAVLFFKCPWKTQRALLEAVFWLGLARGAVLLLPFRFIAPYLGKLNHETPQVCSVSQQAIAQHIAWVISVSSRYTPWRSNCLAQALAGKIMLQRRGICSTLYLGLKRSTNKLEAHAWLRVGEQIVTGGAVKHEFTQISSFGVKTS